MVSVHYSRLQLLRINGPFTSSDTVYPFTKRSDSCYALAQSYLDLRHFARHRYPKRIRRRVDSGFTWGVRERFRMLLLRDVMLLLVERYQTSHSFARKMFGEDLQ